MSTPTKYEGHTPGPWEARKGNGWAVVSLAAKQWPNHDAPKSITGWGCVTQTEADALLIADAPELLTENARLREALREISVANCACRSNVVGEENWHSERCLANKAKLALAAGKGEMK